MVPCHSTRNVDGIKFSKLGCIPHCKVIREIKSDGSLGRKEVVGALVLLGVLVVLMWEW